MIHHTCDRCQQRIDPQNDMRYVIRVEIEAAMESDDDDYDCGVDHLEELSDALESSDEYCSSTIGEDLYQRKRFDLCGNCYRQYLKNPLGRELNVPFGFSKN